MYYIILYIHLTIPGFKSGIPNYSRILLVMAIVIRTKTRKTGYPEKPMTTLTKSRQWTEVTDVMAEMSIAVAMT